MTQPPHATPPEPRAFWRVLGVGVGISAAIAATYWVPALHPLRPWQPRGDYVPFWNVVGREWLGQGAALKAEQAALLDLQRRSQGPSQPLADATVREPPSKPPPQAVFPPYVAPAPLERPEHGVEPPEALDSYFRKLTLVDLKVEGAVARAGHWGDSVLGVDGITSAIRRRLQSRFGDAGHGFHLMDRYNPSYRQQGIDFTPDGGWSRCLIVQECRKQDRRYGYGGLIAESSGGAQSTWRTPSQGFGQTVSLFELWFARQERGGDLEIVVDGDRKIVVSTQGEHLEDAWHDVPVEPGAHSFRVRAVGGGAVRAYGVVLENDGPGVVWDGMALIGGSTRGLRTQQPEHIANQIRRRDLDLIVFLFGGNDMERNYVDLKQSMQPYHDEYGEVLTLFRAGKPGVACLIMSVTDHGQRAADDGIISRSFARTLSTAQREVARQQGCGFFDTYEAMGGAGSVARWYQARPRLISPDLGHPTPAGHELIADLLTSALLHGYESYRERMRGQPLPELTSGVVTRRALERAGSKAENATRPAQGDDTAEGVADTVSVAP